MFKISITKLTLTVMYIILSYLRLISKDFPESIETDDFSTQTSCMQVLDTLLLRIPSFDLIAC